jgi:hypothetical protein
MLGVSTADEAGMSSPVEGPQDIFKRVGRLCLALPEVTVRVDAASPRRHQ